MLTAQRLKQLMEYDPTTGEFTRLVMCGGRLPGSLAGRLNSKGYWEISVDNRRYKSHRLAWLYIRGERPTKLIDHKDRNKANNKFENLREATNAQNTTNVCDARTHNKSGLLGVSDRGRFYVSEIRYGKTRIYLGCFETAQKAHAAYTAAKARLHQI